MCFLFTTDRRFWVAGLQLIEVGSEPMPAGQERTGVGQFLWFSGIKDDCANAPPSRAPAMYLARLLSSFASMPSRLLLPMPGTGLLCL